MVGATTRRRARTWLYKALFVLGSFTAAGLVAAGVVSGADQPSISSDHSDYASGDTVALSGAGWQAGGVVQILVEDDQADPWSHEAELTAAADGTVSDSFDLPDVAGEFSVTATAPSGTATSAFTATTPTPSPPAPTGTPTLDSDEEEYAPGATVALTGSDWHPGDDVHLTVDDDADDAWDHSSNVTVAADGTITDTFDLPDRLTAELTATATDPADRSATATFETVSAEFGAATEPFLVRFASGTSTETQAQILAAVGAEDLSYIAPLRIHGVLLPGGAAEQASVDALRSNPSVTRVEPDRTREAGSTPNDSSYSDQWSLTKIGWDNVFGEASVNGSARVAVLDTGVDGSHPDLDANVVSGTSMLDGSNGLSDLNGHGTAMAGIIAAETNNGVGVAGVGYAGVQVMPVTVLDSDGTGQDSDIIEGVVYAADNGADVILMAFSNPGYSEMLQAAIDYAWDEGVVLVAATGNDGSSTVTFPAGDRSVIGVSNTDQSDSLNSSSNHGQAVFLGAPGTGIATTSAGGGYTTITGTSASAAEVAGAAALIRAASGATNGVIVSRLAKNAEAAGSQAQTGNGRLNLDRAIADTSTASIQPVGAAPLGGGGPFVGPYVAAAKQASINDQSQGEGNIGNTTMAFTVSTNGNGTGTVNYTTAPSGANPATEGIGTCDPGEDYIDSSGILTFAASGGGNEPKTINVTICGDTSFEPNETFTVTLSNPTPSGGSGMNIGDGTGVGTITNDDAANTAPTVGIVNPPATANEGQTNTYNLTITDPNAGDTFTFVSGFPSCGTGGALVGGSASIDSLAKTGIFQCSFADGPETPTVQVRIQDDSGAQSNTPTLTVRVDNVSPTIAISGAANVNEGSSYSLTLGAVTDPGTDTVASYVVHWGDGDTNTYGTNGVKTHTYADGPANRAITVDLVDEDGTHLDRANAFSVQVGNVPPTIAISGAASVNEASPYILTLGAVTDPGNDTLSSYVVHWGDGNSDTYSSGGVKAHTYADGPATRSVTIDLVDEDGTHVNRANALSVQVDNVPPTITTVTAETPIDEGDSSLVTVTASDPAGVNDPLSYQFDCTGDSAFEVGPQAGNSHSCSYADNGSFTVNVRVTDGDEGADTDTAAVVVVNVPPTITISGATSVNEGSVYSLTLGAVGDPGADTVSSYVVHWGDGATDTYATNGVKTHSYADGPATRAITVDLIDEDGTFLDRANALSVQVDNVPPSIAISGAASVNEGFSYSLTLGTVSDPGADTVSSYVVHWGDGNSDTYPTNGVKTHTYADGPATRAITVDLIDEDGTFLDRANALSVQVDNVEPVITAPAGQSSNEGNSATFDLGSFTDPGADSPWRVSVDWGDTSTDTVFTESSPGAITDTPHTYADDALYTATITVEEENGGGPGDDIATFQVLVANVPPAVTPPVDQAASEGTPNTFALGSFTDPGDDDPWKVTVDWGDTSAATVFDEVSPGAIADKPHTYADDGLYTVTVTVDEDNGAGADGSATFKVSVANVAPDVTPPADQTANEGTAKTFDLGGFTDPGADSPWKVTIDWGDPLPDTVLTESTPGAITDTAHTYADNGTFAVSITVAEESGTGPGSDTATFQIVVANAAPTVAKPAFQPVLIACQTMTTLTGISFSDSGVNDNPWTVDIDWGDASAHTTYLTATQGAQPNQNHTYSTPGPHSATVTVTDKDTGTGANTSTAPVTVFQYTVDFLPPFDDSTPSGLIVNKMKNGRVVPVKARIRDECAGALLTGPGPVVTIKVSKTSGTGTGDPVEEYADAGESSAGTSEFRQTGDYWIYNLDSKALGLVINNLYRVDVYVDGVKATVSNWAVLQPVK